MSYRNFINGKRVVFVGAWPGIAGLGMGRFIDDFDIIVKTNGSINFDSDEYKKDYGSRVDVLYTNNQFYRNMKPFPLDKWGLKWLCMKTCSNADMNKYSKITPTRTIKSTMDRVNLKCKSATMGAYIYTDILDCNPSEFFLTGVDFFASKKKVFEHDNYREYIDGYLPDKIRSEGNIINAGKTEDGHNFLDNANYIYDLFLRNENFTMSHETEELLRGIVNGTVEQN